MIVHNCKCAFANFVPSLPSLTSVTDPFDPVALPELLDTTTAFSISCVTTFSFTAVIVAPFVTVSVVFSEVINALYSTMYEVVILFNNSIVITCAPVSLLVSIVIV